MKTAESQRRREDEGGDITREVIGAAIEVHRTMGPGLLESLYQECLAYELGLRSVRFRSQVAVPVEYKGAKVGTALRMDLIVEDTVVVEIKTVEHVLPVHRAQLLTYLKLGGYRLGLLLNFNVPRLIDGIERMVLSRRPSLP
jgi:GxxExxY protein